MKPSIKSDKIGRLADCINADPYKFANTYRVPDIKRLIVALHRASTKNTRGGHRHGKSKPNRKLTKAIEWAKE